MALLWFTMFGLHKREERAQVLRSGGILSKQRHCSCFRAETGAQFVVQYLTCDPRMPTVAKPTIDPATNQRIDRIASSGVFTGECGRHVCALLFCRTGHRFEIMSQELVTRHDIILYLLFVLRYLSTRA